MIADLELGDICCPEVIQADKVADAIIMMHHLSGLYFLVSAKAFITAVGNCSCLLADPDYSVMRSWLIAMVDDQELAQKATTTAP